MISFFLCAHAIAVHLSNEDVTHKATRKKELGYDMSSTAQIVQNGSFKTNVVFAMFILRFTRSLTHFIAHLLSGGNFVIAIVELVSEWMLFRAQPGLEWQFSKSSPGCWTVLVAEQWLLTILWMHWLVQLWNISLLIWDVCVMMSRRVWGFWWKYSWRWFINPVAVASVISVE